MIKALRRVSMLMTMAILATPGAAAADGVYHSERLSFAGGADPAFHGQVAAGPRPSAIRALAAECTPGPLHNERTGTRRPGSRDVLPAPSVRTLTVESKRAVSTGATRRWNVPERARISAWGIAPMRPTFILYP